MSDADEILKFKDLLDNNIITKEEFEKKKREILNLESNVKKEIQQNSSNIEQKNIFNNQNINKTMTSERKKLGNVNIIISWIFFAIFVLAAFGNLVNGFKIITYLIYMVMALICCPAVIEKLQETLKININTAIRVIAIFILFLISGIIMIGNYEPNINSQRNGENQVNPVFVSGTDGKDFFQNILCKNTQCEYREPDRLKADNIIPYDTFTYITGNDIYSFEVTTNTKNEIANIQMFFYKYGAEDPTNYFMTTTRLNYPNSNVEQLTSFITENIGKDNKIKIGNFTFHFFKGTSDNCVILDIYTDEFAKFNGN